MLKNTIALYSSSTMQAILSCAASPFLALAFVGVITTSAKAQVIRPVPDGTNTQVNQRGDTFHITGGTQAGANLFHSFQQFGLNQRQIANFISNAATQNILGRVVGGSPSIIQGLIRVSGSNANLYLMNPAGMVFSSTASLNVPGSFTATTANAIGIGNSWFNAVGPNNYSALGGTPEAFAFTTSQPGAIVSAANLAVNSGRNLTLLGGTVVNTGTLSAPEGTITIAAIPGENLVRISQPGSLLSLEVLPSSVKNQVNPLPFRPASLPELLTGGGFPGATALKVENGVVKLVVSGATVYSQPGDVTVSNMIDTSGVVGGTVQALGDRVNVTSATINASGLGGGGQVLLGGDFRGQGTVPNAKRTFISADSVIDASAKDRGNAGRVIVWANETTGFYGQILATGGAINGNGGFVEVSGKENLAFNGQVDVSASKGNNGTLLLDPRNIFIQAVGNDDAQLNDGQILAGDVGGNPPDMTISAATLQNLTGTVRLEATEDITIADDVSFDVDTNTALKASDVIFIADADGNGSGDFSMGQTRSINVPNGNLTISGANVHVGQVGQINQPPTDGVANVTLTATNGDITTGTIVANGGDGRNIVTLTAPQGSITLSGTIQAGDMNANDVPAPGREGQINITARRFRATNPELIFNNSNIDKEPVSLYAFPAEQGKGINGTVVPEPLVGQFSLQFDVSGYDTTPRIVGTGPRLITIRLLEDTSFTHAVPLDSSGSGTEGRISIGTGFAPNAVVLLTDNSFSATLLPTETPPDTASGADTASVATVLQRPDQELTENVRECDPTIAQREILDVSAVASRSPDPSRSGSPTQGLPPCVTDAAQVSPNP